MQIACQHVFNGLFKAYLGSCCPVLFSSGSAKVPEIRVFAGLLGILHAVCLVQRLSLSACSESLIDDKLNGRCVVSQIMKSAALNMKAVRASSL